MRKRRRRCLNCKELFDPHPSTKYWQKYCSKGECQKVRKRKNYTDFCRKTPYYDKDGEGTKRVQQWRKKNPKYWQNETRNKRGRPSGEDSSNLKLTTLQTACESELVDLQMDNLHLKLNALQTALNAQTIVLQGLACDLNGGALQTGLGGLLGSWYDKGRRLHQTVEPEIANKLTEELYAGYAFSADAGASPAGTKTLQLGGSSSDP